MMPYTSQLGNLRPQAADRYRMIRSVEIRRFKCFEEFSLSECAPINVIVGDNSAGKTALIEAIFLALCSNPEKALALRQWRGHPATFTGSQSSFFQDLFGDLYFNTDFSEPVEISLSGSGPEARSVRISRGPSEFQVFSGHEGESHTEVAAPIHFKWRDGDGNEYNAPIYVRDNGISFKSTGEIVPEFFIFPAQLQTSGQDAATRLSSLRKKREDRKFVETFTQVFDWIEDLSVETSAGSSIIHAAVKGATNLLPLSSVSGAANRFAAILLAIAHRREGVVLVDEIENGVFYSRHPKLTRALIDFSREYECQLFLSTHSREWLEAFVESAGEDMSDIALWRLERQNKTPTVQRFSGNILRDGIEYGSEIRG